jgi:hypothetical protein
MKFIIGFAFARECEESETPIQQTLLNGVTLTKIWDRQT